MKYYLYKQNRTLTNGSFIYIVEFIEEINLEHYNGRILRINYDPHEWINRVFDMRYEYPSYGSTNWCIMIHSSDSLEEITDMYTMELL